MLSTTDFRRGLKIEMDGVPYEIVDFLHVKPGKGGAFIRTKLKNMINGRVVENTFRSGEKMVKPDLESKEMQYLYRESDEFVFMDMESYEQLHVGVEPLGEKGGYLKDGMELKMLLYKGQPLDIDLPASVVLEVTDTEPGVKGDTVSGANKPAVVESGITVNVPLFVNTGDRIKVDTRTGAYIGRE
ncbi:translation elongation factor P [Solidesulfovibrio carbinoliphilus subsp. oakridgensis]|uniref:Elongation factor P n=1 Tax=Solidesulfovibrio carbinoliphilus subsp. oakridgensis TaxID=694327 RepID=G7Q5X0_9BACT|nr:elongation factor P [Solidesulfovibrio carbinoliphilus]EHJ46907.1 translation elongation factor P [Solidesulfovibrio carbinoliphilus subsp. oakridgensis]